MAEDLKRPLKVFLCHASGDKPVVRALYQRLVRDGVDAWLDKEKLLPGQDWQLEIPKAVRESDVVVVCLSNKSITKEGYVQKEIKFALDIASEKPEGTIFLIPARLEECNVPGQLGSWQWVDLFETNGYEWLMRSLRLRAEKLGMRVGDTLYTDPELEQRLDQLYTEGLAALWVEDWDKAYHRFQAILHEKPDHIQAATKLDEAKRQKHLNDLYTKALNTYENEDWQAAIELFEKLAGEVTDYKDASLLLKKAQKKKQLTHLYDEAHKLYKAREWQAVIKVFAQITSIEPNYPDPDGLLTSSEKEFAELKRLAELNELYKRGIRGMDAGQWYEARELLEQVHKAQTRFLETERLLRRIENEIAKVEELNQRNIYVNTLYEQAHGLVRSRNWREALAKIEEIHKLDNDFEDKEGIAEKAKTALKVEEDEVRRQNQLAAMYAEAVRLLKEGKYQEALDKWQEVKVMDPKYPDRQRVHTTVYKKLAEVDKARQNRPVFYRNKLFLAGMFVTLLVTASYLIMSSGKRMSPTPTATAEPTMMPSSISPTSIIANDPKILFSEDFEDGKAQNTTVVSGRWRIMPDETGNKVYDIDNSKGADFPGIDIGSDSWQDYKINLRSRFVGDNNTWIIIYFRHGPEAASYFISVQLPSVILGYAPHGSDWNQIATKETGLLKNMWYWLSIEVRGSEIKVSIDNTEIFNINDTHFNSGGITIQSGQFTHAQIDDIQVTSLER